MNNQDKKSFIQNLIFEYVKDYEKNPAVKTVWREPLVGFADANDPYIQSLKKIISPTHSVPADVVKNATIVIAYFLPFTQELADTNFRHKNLASPQWALAYEETNVLLQEINMHLICKLAESGYQAAVSPESDLFNQDKLISNWSHRHFAYAAGLGTFGLNNMLITEKGCCGRFSTVVTNLETSPDSVMKDEQCLYKKEGKCGLCAEKCPAGALSENTFYRHRCYDQCMKNAKIYTGFGSSYTVNSDDSEVGGSEVCGKCMVHVPCSYK